MVKKRAYYTKLLQELRFDLANCKWYQPFKRGGILFQISVVEDILKKLP